MLTKETGVVISFISLILCIISFSINFYERNKYSNVNVSNKLIYMKYGTALCGEFYITACGVVLKKCSDEKEYYCLKDVSIKE